MGVVIQRLGVPLLAQVAIHDEAALPFVLGIRPDLVAETDDVRDGHVGVRPALLGETAAEVQIVIDVVAVPLLGEQAHALVVLPAVRADGLAHRLADARDDQMRPVGFRLVVEEHDHAPVRPVDGVVGAVDVRFPASAHPQEVRPAHERILLRAGEQHVGQFGGIAELLRRPPQHRPQREHIGVAVVRRQDVVLVVGDGGDSGRDAGRLDDLLNLILRLLVRLAVAHLSSFALEGLRFRCEKNFTPFSFL